jgi:anti-anti-sigma factor
LALAEREIERRIVDGTLTIEVGSELERCDVRVSGELDAGNVAALERELDRLLFLSGDLRTVVLDLEDLEFIDAAGLNCLLKASKRSRGFRDRLELLRPSPQVERILALTGIRKALSIIDE